MGILAAVSAKFSERHALGWMLFCYFVTISDPRVSTTGAVAYMRENYGLYFVAFMALWFGFGLIACLFKRLSPLGLLLAAVPQWMYTVIGLWLLFKSPSAPFATFFVHFSGFGLTVYLIRSRIRAIAKGSHPDDTIYPFAD